MLLHLCVQVHTKNDYTINKIFARAGQMKSTAGYWMAERTKWYNLVLYWQHYFAQIPSVFLTVSEPELHDPPLHKLLDQVLVGESKQYYGAEPPGGNGRKVGSRRAEEGREAVMGQWLAWGYE